MRKKNYRYIYNYIYENLLKLELNDLKIFRDKILNLEVIFVAVEEWDPFSIFSTLNATWKDLTPLDLIKNQIFRWYPNEPHLNEPHDSWKKLLQNIKDQKKFLNYFWSSRFKKVSDSKIFWEFKNEIIEKNKDIKEFLINIYDDSEIFQLIVNPQEWDRDNDEVQILFSLRALNNFSIKVAHSILISLIRAYKEKTIDKKWIVNALSIIEKYHFINNAVASLRSSWLDTMYSKYAKSIYEAKNKEQANRIISKLTKQLSDKIPEIKDQYDSLFEQKTFFTKNDTKNKRLINYILKKIELKKQNYNISINNVSLEHILPQSTWIENEIWKIWNIVLLDDKLNSLIWKKEYKIKRKKVLANSTIISTKEVFSRENFTNKDIEERTNELKNYMFDWIWK